MTFGERLVEARENKGYKQNEFAELVGITPTRLNYWEKDKREPDVSMIKKMSLLLEVSCDWLMGNDDVSPNNFNVSNSEKTILNKYRSLDVHGKTAVNSILDVEYNRCQTSQEQEQEQDNIINLPYYYGGVSAGFGNPTVDEYKVLRQVPRTALTEKADFIVQVNGDSMFPTYSDGDLLLIKSQQSVEIGEVGIFVVDGSEMYVKRYDGKKLVPDNKKYPDIPISEDTVCQGKVIGKL